MNRKQTNSYLKMGVIILLSAVAGGILGFGFSFIGSRSGADIGMAADFALAWMQRMLLPILGGLTVLTVLAGEISLGRLKKIGAEVLRSEDEECDYWEYEEERAGAFGLNMNILSQVLSIIVLSVGYSFRYIDSSDGARNNLLYASIVFISCWIYDAFWQIRYIKRIQNTHPEKQGDPSSLKFQKQWLNSCDEAEKEVIFQSSYKTYQMMNKGIPAFLLITMLMHLFCNTGLLAIIVVAAMWLLITVTYTHSCVVLKGKKAGKLRR
ncbi:MAG: DUF3169 family protein [Blautia sp.]|nr:DUF3169 family protein [Blautia sp.]MDY5032573.1 DUF3169 family protein [Blautia sp.]